MGPSSVQKSATILQFLVWQMEDDNKKVNTNSYTLVYRSALIAYLKSYPKPT